MPTPDTFIDRLLQLAQRLPGLAPDALAGALAEARALEAGLRTQADALLAQPAGAEAIDLGVQLAQAAIDAGPAVQALATALDWQARVPTPAVLARVVAIHRQLARSSLLRALRPLAKVPPAAAWPLAADPPAAPEASAEATPAAVDTAMDVGVLRNIATYHREHERYYTLDITESAADLYREANKLRIVAGAWLSARERAAPADVDFRLPQYQAAGCDDLNALDAIAAIGVLFMEGDGEPAELRMLKGKLQAQAGAQSQVGQWLSAKMDAAWQREQAACTPELIGVVQARFNTITTNWRGAREMALSGRLLTLAVASLQAIDFTPAALRAGRQAAGRRLLEAAWTLSLAAQVRARSAADLAENDRNWTTYLDGLPAHPSHL